jgi:small-conductance mechanosensitive channel
MTAQDHNKTLCLAYSFLSTVFILLILVSPWIIARNVDNQPSPRRVGQIVSAAIIFSVVLLITLLFTSTTYGLFKRRLWARTLALISAVLVIWLFPLGTALGVYTWYAIHSEDMKQLYSRPSP